MVSRCLLGLLHFLTRGDKVYTTMAYKFSPEPPFGILGVSRALPLLGSTKAFASGLLVLEQQKKVVVTYGVDNAESRALVMDLDYLDTLFECA